MTQTRIMDHKLLGSSPTSASSLLAFVSHSQTNQDVAVDNNPDKDTDQEDAMLAWDEFVAKIPDALATRKCDSIEAGSESDPVLNMFHRLQASGDDHDWRRFAHFDLTKGYTRNLIATDHETYTLMLLCWNPGHSSPIHDHPCDGCWMKVLRGEVQEQRYKEDSCGDLRCVQNETYSEGEIVFIKDSLGFHKVGSPSATTPAVTLHLYSPPYDQCRLWLNEKRSSCLFGGACQYYSESGIITT